MPSPLLFDCLRAHIWSVAISDKIHQSSSDERMQGNSMPLPTEPSLIETMTLTQVEEITGTLLSNLIVRVEGKAFIRREGEASDQRIPVGVGTRVEADDLLLVSSGEVSVFCGIESLWEDNPHRFTSSTNPIGVPCLTGAPLPPAPDISRLRGEMNVMPDDATDTVPYVLRPRGGWVSEERPLLRWQLPPNVETITLTLVSDDGIQRPPITVGGSETPYPAEWEPLQAGGAGYRLQINGNNNSNGFSLLEMDSINALRQQTELIQAQIHSEPGQTLVLAELLLHYGLWSEAVDLLLALPDGEEETAIQKQLGQIYLFIGLFDEAQATLSQPLLSVEQSGLPETAANSLYLLGWATCGLGQVSETQTHWEAALEQYRALGAEQMIEEIGKQLSRASVTCPLP